MSLRLRLSRNSELRWSSRLAVLVAGTTGSYHCPGSPLQISSSKYLTWFPLVSPEKRPQDSMNAKRGSQGGPRGRGERPDPPGYWGVVGRPCRKDLCLPETETGKGWEEPWQRRGWCRLLLCKHGAARALGCASGSDRRRGRKEMSRFSAKCLSVWDKGALMEILYFIPFGF